MRVVEAKIKLFIIAKLKFIINSTFVSIQAILFYELKTVCNIFSTFFFIFP